MKGFYTFFCYYGYIPSLKDYRPFESEQAYEEYFKEYKEELI